MKEVHPIKKYTFLVININNDIFNLSSSGYATPPIRGSYHLPSAELKNERNNIAYRLKNTNAVKNEIERKLKKLLGNNIKISKFEQDSNNDNEIDKIKEGKTGHLKYTLEIEKNIKILQGKKEKEIKPKYQIDLEYESINNRGCRSFFPIIYSS